MSLHNLSFLFLPVLLTSLYLYAVAIVSTRFPTLRNKRIVLLIAHPDDEAMFFAPTVLALTRPELANHVQILCLSSGNAAGLGATRRNELVASGLILGLRRGEDVRVIDDETAFPDSMTRPWAADKIASVLRDAFVPAAPARPAPARKLASAEATSRRAPPPPPPPPPPPAPTIDVLLTFDPDGVSCHPNHGSLYHGARAFLALLAADSDRGHAPPVDLYTLGSVSMLRKYLGILDVFSTMGSAARDVSTKGGATAGKEASNRPAALIFMHGFGTRGWATACEAMIRAHVSQMVWFRWGWITVSRYMFINDLRLESL